MKRESPSPEGLPTANCKTPANIRNELMFLDRLLALGMVRTAHNGALHSENILPGPAKGQFGTNLLAKQSEKMKKQTCLSLRVVLGKNVKTN